MALLKPNRERTSEKKLVLRSDNVGIPPIGPVVALNTTGFDVDLRSVAEMENLQSRHRFPLLQVAFIGVGFREGIADAPEKAFGQQQEPRLPTHSVSVVGGFPARVHIPVKACQMTGEAAGLNMKIRRARKYVR